MGASAPVLKRDRIDSQDACIQQTANGATHLRVPLARFGDGKVILIKPDRVIANARVCGTGAHDRQNALHGSKLIVRDRLYSQPDAASSIPVANLLQIRIMLAQLLDTHGGTKDVSECADE